MADAPKSEANLESATVFKDGGKRVIDKSLDCWISCEREIAAKDAELSRLRAANERLEGVLSALGGIASDNNMSARSRIEQVQIICSALSQSPLTEPQGETVRVSRELLMRAYNEVCAGLGRDHQTSSELRTALSAQGR